MASKYTHDQVKQTYFPLNFDQNKYELLSKTRKMKNYISYSYDWYTIYIILLCRKGDTYKNISSLSANSFHAVLPSSSSSCPNENITHFGSFLHEDDLLPRESEPIEPLCTIRLHIIVYYEIIIYRLVEGNIIATLSSRGREKSQFFFSITFRNYHVVLLGYGRLFCCSNLF